MSSKKDKIKKNYNETKANLKMTWSFVKEEKKSMFLLLIINIILSLIGVLLPVLSAKRLLNLTNGLFDELLKVVIFISIVEITRNFIFAFNNFLNQKYMIKVVSKVQLKMVEEIIKIKTKEMDKLGTGTFIDRLGDASSIVYIFNDLLSHFVEFISNFGVLIATLYINKYIFIFFVLSSLIKSYLHKKRRDMYANDEKKYRKINEKKTSLATEIIRGLKDIKLLNSSSSVLNKTKLELNKINKEKIQMERKYRKNSIIIDNVRVLLDITFVLLGIFLINKNELTIATLLVLDMYKDRVESVLLHYDRVARLIKSFNLSASRIFEIIDNTYDKENESGIVLPKLEGNITFENVNFSYNPNEPVLHNINLTINKGEKVGFVGSSGSGKSTIFNLLSRLYLVDSGKILIDGTNINDINISFLRDNLTLIPQTPYIFNFSVLDNLLLANNNATKEEIEQVVKKSLIYDKIMELDNTYDTLLGESGVILSGGEKQRLSIARALLKNSNIILFDESTSALDNITQGKVQNQIYKLDKTKTVLIIAHRLSTVINCDKIVVLSNGRIIDVGTHEELLSRCNIYKKLYKYEN